MGRPAHTSGARIETLLHARKAKRWIVAPLTRAGRGLKLVGEIRGERAEGVAPLTRAVRGLTQRN